MPFNALANEEIAKLRDQLEGENMNGRAMCGSWRNAIERAIILSTNGALRLDRDALPLQPNGDLEGDLRVRKV